MTMGTNKSYSTKQPRAEHRRGHRKTRKTNSKITPKSLKNCARRPSKTAHKKYPPKNTAKIKKYRKCVIWGAKKMGNERGLDELFVTFSAPDVLGNPLGHPRDPKWSQNLPQEPPGPLRASILNDFCLIFDACFL